MKWETARTLVPEPEIVYSKFNKAAILSMGVNLDYPKGRPDWLEITNERGDWRRVELIGSWFVDAFRGPMSNLQRFVVGEDDELVSSVDDAWHTMAVVEACYLSDAAGGVKVPGGDT